MSKFTLEAVSVQVIKTSDGKEFNDMALAQAHQNVLDSAEIIAVPVQAYLNTNGLIDRNRKQKQTVVESVLAFLVGAGVDLTGVEAVEQTVFDTPTPAKVDATEATEATDTAETTETAPVEAGAEDELF